MAFLFVLILPTQSAEAPQKMAAFGIPEQTRKWCSIPAISLSVER
jgi:hypothetical protein